MASGGPWAACSPENLSYLLSTKGEVQRLLEVEAALEEDRRRSAFASAPPSPGRLLRGLVVRFRMSRAGIKCYHMRRVTGCAAASEAALTAGDDSKIVLHVQAFEAATSPGRPPPLRSVPLRSVSGTNPLLDAAQWEATGQAEVAELSAAWNASGARLPLQEAAAVAWRRQVALSWHARHAADSPAERLWHVPALLAELFDPRGPTALQRQMQAEGEEQLQAGPEHAVQQLAPAAAEMPGLAVPAGTGTGGGGAQAAWEPQQQVQEWPPAAPPQQPGLQADMQQPQEAAWAFGQPPARPDSDSPARSSSDRALLAPLAPAAAAALPAAAAAAPAYALPDLPPGYDGSGAGGWQAAAGPAAAAWAQPGFAGGRAIQPLHTPVAALDLPPGYDGSLSSQAFLATPAAATPAAASAAGQFHGSAVAFGHFSSPVFAAPPQEPAFLSPPQPAATPITPPAEGRLVIQAGPSGERTAVVRPVAAPAPAPMPAAQPQLQAGFGQGQLFHPGPAAAPGLQLRPQMAGPVYTQHSDTAASPAAAGSPLQQEPLLVPARLPRLPGGAAGREDLTSAHSLQWGLLGSEVWISRVGKDCGISTLRNFLQSECRAVVEVGLLDEEGRPDLAFARFTSAREAAAASERLQGAELNACHLQLHASPAQLSRIRRQYPEEWAAAQQALSALAGPGFEAAPGGDWDAGAGFAAAGGGGWEASPGFTAAPDDGDWGTGPAYAAAAGARYWEAGPADAEQHRGWSHRGRSRSRSWGRGGAPGWDRGRSPSPVRHFHQRRSPSPDGRFQHPGSFSPGRGRHPGSYSPGAGRGRLHSPSRDLDASGFPRGSGWQPGGRFDRSPSPPPFRAPAGPHRPAPALHDRGAGAMFRDGRRGVWDECWGLEWQCVQALMAEGSRGLFLTALRREVSMPRQLEPRDVGALQDFLSRRQHLFGLRNVDPPPAGRSFAPASAFARPGAEALLRYKRDLLQFLADHPPRVELGELFEAVPPPPGMPTGMLSTACSDPFSFLKAYLWDEVETHGGPRAYPPAPHLFTAELRPEDARRQCPNFDGSWAGGCPRGPACPMSHSRLREYG